jgi:hypothetical protein
VLSASELRPGGDGASGTVRVQNQTSHRLDVAVRTSTLQKDLDRIAWIGVADGARGVLEARLGASRSWSRSTVSLDPGEARRLDARVWIPRNAAGGWQAARAEVTLEFRGTRAGAR